MKFLLSIILLIGLSEVRSQFIEFGGGFGAMQYTGDLTRYPDITKANLAFSGIYRMNFSPTWSVRLGLLKGRVSGSDDSPIDALAEERRWTFSYPLFEMSTIFEYHFIDYRNEKLRVNWSPYAFMGLGIMRLGDVGYTYESFNPLQITIPMGGGVKYVAGKQFTIAFELGARKTFFDYLDGVSDGDTYIKDFHYGNPNDTDWYFYSGISLTYVLYKIECPFPYVPNKSMLTRIKSY